MPKPITEDELDFARDFADVVREYMRERGWTQKDLATRLGMSQGAVSFFLSNKRRREGLIYCKRLAAAFDMSLLEFCCRIESGHHGTYGSLLTMDPSRLSKLSPAQRMEAIRDLGWYTWFLQDRLFQMRKDALDEDSEKSARSGNESVHQQRGRARGASGDVCARESLADERPRMPLQELEERYGHDALDAPLPDAPKWYCHVPHEQISYQRKQQLRYIAQGRCPHCGGAPVPGRKRCRASYQARNASKRRRRARQEQAR